VSGEIMRSAYQPHHEDSDYGQAGSLWRNVLSDTERDHLVSNIATHMSDGVDFDVQARALEHWRRVDPQLGASIAKRLGNGHA